MANPTPLDTMTLLTLTAASVCTDRTVCTKGVLRKQSLSTLKHAKSGV